MTVDPVVLKDGKFRLLSALPGETIGSVAPIVWYQGKVQPLADTGQAIGATDPVVAKGGILRRLSGFEGESYPAPPPPPPPPPSVTWSATDKSASCTLTNSGLTATFAGNSAGHFVRGSTSKTGGKWYYRVLFKGDAGAIGIAKPGVTLAGPVGADANAMAYMPVNTSVFHNNAWVPYYGAFPSAANGDHLGVAFDLDSGKAYFSKNGTWLNSGNPAAGTGGLDISAIGATATPLFGSYYDAASIDADFADATGCPSGFSVLA